MSIKSHPNIQASSAARAAQVREATQAPQAIKPPQETRPTASTPCGTVYTDTPAYAHYLEVKRIHDWLLAFQTDMENLSLSKPEAVARITAFYDTLQPAHGGLKTGPLELIRKSLDGNTDIRIGMALSALRLDIGNHWHYAMGSAAQVIPRPLTDEQKTDHRLRYAGPFFKVAPHVNPNQLEIDAARAAVLARQ